MAYMLLIVEPVGQRAERGLEGGQEAYETMLGFTAELKAAGRADGEQFARDRRHAAAACRPRLPRRSSPTAPSPRPRR